MQQYRLGQLSNGVVPMKVGDRLVLEDSLWSGFDVVYAGMPSDKLFSLLCREREIFSTRMQGNLYFPSDSVTIDLHDTKLEVREVKPDILVLACYPKQGTQD